MGLTVSLLALLLLVGCSSGRSGSSSPRNWQAFASEKGKFSAEFPFPVKVEEVGDTTFFQASGGDANFRISYSPVRFIESKEAALRELRRIRDGTADSLNATMNDARNVDFHGCPGIEFTLTFTSDGAKFQAHSRSIRCGNRYYEQIVTLPAGKNADTNVRRFFDSFQVDTD